MSLLDGLVSYWALDETSGNALDSHATNDLTETSGIIDSATGKISTCRDFESADTEYFGKADNTDLSTGDIDFTITCWLNAETVGAFRGIITKADATDPEFFLLLIGVSQLRFSVSGAAAEASSSFVTASNFGTMPTATWIFVACWHDSVADTINIQVNNGTANSVSHSAGVYDGVSEFQIGARSSSSQYWDGLIDEVGFWKRVLTSDERTQLYNGGAGFAYPFEVAAPDFLDEPGLLYHLVTAW